MMTETEAFQTLIRAAQLARLTREEHLRVQQAEDVLEKVLRQKCCGESPKTETKQDASLA